MRVHVRWFLVSVSFLFPILLASKPIGPDPTRQEVEQLIVSFHLDQAEVKLRELRSTSYRAYYQANILIYRHLGQQDATSFEAIEQQWGDLTRLVEQLPKDATIRGVLLSDMLCKRALVEFLNHQYLSAVNHARLGYKQISRQATRFPNEVEQSKLQGLFNVVLGAVPSRYQWLINLLGFNGDLATGIDQLETAATHSQWLALEAEIILYHVKKNILNRSEEAMTRLRKVRLRTGANMLVDYFLATGLISIKRNEAALQVLLRRNHYAKDGVFLIPFWDYQLGKVYAYRDNMGRAQHYLTRFLQNYQGRIFRTDANFRLGMAFTLGGAYPAGKLFFSAVAEQDGDQFDEDDYAQHMCARFVAQPPHPALLALFRARNAYDGGYFERAIDILNDLDPATLEADDQIEWWYRLGRIQHSQGQLSEAKTSYGQCLEKRSSKDQRWMHAYSCYFRAEIERNMGDDATARKMYRRALAFDDYFYQDGLENRCKAALAEMKR